MSQSDLVLTENIGKVFLFRSAPSDFIGLFPVSGKSSMYMVTMPITLTR